MPRKANPRLQRALAKKAAAAPPQPEPQVLQVRDLEVSLAEFKEARTANMSATIQRCEAMLKRLCEALDVKTADLYPPPPPPPEGQVVPQ
jgi:hypothetical protein